MLARSADAVSSCDEPRGALAFGSRCWTGRGDRRLDRMVSTVRDGLSGVLVVRREARIRRTMLLDDAVAAAAEMQGARRSVLPAPEQLQEEREHVQDVEEDSGRQRGGVVAVRPSQAVEVEQGISAEDR
jgi:hypothetical protein